MAAATVKEVKLSDLDDDLMQKFLNKMSITEQTAVTRVCKRFKANVYKSTTIMFANELPEEFRYNVIAKLPKLKKIHFTIEFLELVRMGKVGQQLDRNLRHFLESVAAKNPNIQRLFGLPPDYTGFYIKMAKKYHKKFDGTKFKSFVSDTDYEKLLAKYPDIKMRYRAISVNGKPDVPANRRWEETLSDPNLVSLDIEIKTVDFKLNNIVTIAATVTDLSIRARFMGVEQDYAYIFDCVAKLPLQVFFLEVFTNDQNKIFGWVKRDSISFRRLLELKSLVDISLRIPQSKETYLEVLKCFLECPRNNFHNFSSQSWVNDLSVSNFLLQARNQQLVTSMYLGLQDENDTFPIAQFIQKFSPKYRKFQFKDRGTMVKMVKDCADLIKNQPKVHFVFYANQGSKWIISFRPFQLEPGKIKFSAQLSPSHMKEYSFIPKSGPIPVSFGFSDHEYEAYARLLLKNN